MSRLESLINYLKSKIKENRYTDEITIKKHDIIYILEVLKDCNCKSREVSNNKNKIVCITNEDECGKDEIYCMMYICPNCAWDQVLETDKFCSKCGAKIIWEL